MAIGLHEKHSTAQTVDFSDVVHISIAATRPGCRNVWMASGDIGRTTEKAVMLRQKDGRFAWFPKQALIHVEKSETTTGMMVVADLAQWFEVNDWQRRLFD